MRTLVIATSLFALLCPSTSLPVHAQGAVSAPSLVRGYFAALERKDFHRALSLTAGAAQERTARMAGTLNEEAANHHAEVELRATKLEVDNSPSSSASAANGTAPVQVVFDIDVIGKKWISRKVAGRLTGRAQFYVAADQIVAIEGRIW